MKPSKKILDYMKENFTEVMHTTLNPDGPGAVRIHLIPPKYEEELTNSVAIINGQDIIPVGYAWSILLCEFIKEVNKYSGKSVSDSDIESIKENVATNVKKVFSIWISKRRIKNDLYKIMQTFIDVATHKEPTIEIGYMNIGDYSEYMTAPHRMDIMVSAMTKDGMWHCNQKCLHCYAAGQEHAEEKELTTDEWKQILDKLRKIGVPQVTFTGGEPTMRDDLFELIEYAKWFVSRLNTNGIKLTSEYCEGLRKAELDSIQITFYSVDSEVHNTLVGAKQYDNTVNGIKNALKAGLSVSINTPLCELNKDYVKTLEFLHDLGVTYVTCSGIITTGNATLKNSSKLQLTNEEIKQVLSDAVDYCYSHDMEINFTSPGWIENEFFTEKGIMTPNCGACLSNMAITPSGNVVPCQSWLTGEVLGNFLNDGWGKIWDSPICRARREYSAKMLGKCPLRREKDEKNN